MSSSQYGINSAWARHWDSVCLGTVTLATAITGAVIVIVGNSDIPKAILEENFSVQVVLWIILAAIALMVYLALRLN